MARIRDLSRGEAGGGENEPSSCHEGQLLTELHRVDWSPLFRRPPETTELPFGAIAGYRGPIGVFGVGGSPLEGDPINPMITWFLGAALGFVDPTPDSLPGPTKIHTTFNLGSACSFKWQYALAVFRSVHVREQWKRELQLLRISSFPVKWMSIGVLVGFQATFMLEISHLSMPTEQLAQSIWPHHL